MKGVGVMMRFLNPHQIVRRSACLLACLLGIVSVAHAVIIIPRPPIPRPFPHPAVLNIETGDTSATVSVSDDVARTRLFQTFINPNPFPLEADAFISIPPGAGITDFAATVDGKMTRGEVLDSEKARKTYEDIVRTMRDPGLLEWSENGLAHVRLFPLPAGGSMSMEFELMQVLSADQGMRKLIVPLNSTKKRTGKCVVKVTVNSIRGESARNVYSPTDSLNVEQPEKSGGVVTATVVREANIAGDRDFIMYYEHPGKDIALGMICEKDKDCSQGAFMLLFDPPIQDDVTSGTVVPIDVIFVLDTSGSMNDDGKMGQACKALKRCLLQLRGVDRFSILTFSNTVRQWKDGSLLFAAKDNVVGASQWVDEITATGGTNISEALTRAVQLPSNTEGATSSSENRLRTVIFLTDGQPTVGDVNPESILKTLTKTNLSNLRLFTFGVGNDVNTQLLDAMADVTRAASDYVRPTEDIEVPVSRLFSKVSKPALINLSLNIDGVKTQEMYPPTLPDLFFGNRLIVVGRYDSHGTGTITLSGKKNEKTVRYQNTREFPASTPNVAKRPEKTYVEKLWATRKIGWLIQQYRAGNNNKEVRDELIALGNKYGIVTPFTSILATEDKPVPGSARNVSRDGYSLFRRDMEYASKSMAAPAGPGEAAVAASRVQGQMKSAETIVDINPDDLNSQDVRSLPGGSVLVKKADTQIWIQEGVSAEAVPDLCVKTMSDAWFECVKLVPFLKDAFTVGENVRVKLANGLVVECSKDRGVEALQQSDRDKLLKKP